LENEYLKIIITAFNTVATKKITYATINTLKEEANNEADNYKTRQRLG